MPSQDPADPHYLRPSTEEARQTVQFAIDGMKCESCVEKVETTLRAKEGIDSVTANLQSALVTVTYDARKIDPPAIHELILSTGYQPAGLTS